MTMRRWERVRLALRIAGVMTGAMVPFVGGGLFAGALTAIAAAAAALSVDLPRDRWTPDEQIAIRRRRSTRPNPLMSVLLWRIIPPWREVE